MMQLMAGFVIMFVVLVFNYESMAATKALLVGVGDYKELNDSGELKDLNGPNNDVMAIKESLISYGISEKDIKVLLDKEATRDNIYTVFNQWLVKGTKEGDMAVFFFSGHGSRVRDLNRDEEDNYDEVILPYDMKLPEGNNIIVDDEFGFWLRQLKERTVVVILDSCHSGGASRGIGNINVILDPTPAVAERFIPITDYQPKNQPYSPFVLGTPKGPDVAESVIFIAAANETETAQEIMVDEQNRFYGGFSYGLYKGMNQLNLPSYKKLFQHAKYVVKDELKLPQTPQMKISIRYAEEPIFKGPSALTRQTFSSHSLEIEGGKVIVVVDTLSDASDKEMQALRKGLQDLPYVRLLQNRQGFFDRIIKGEKRGGIYHVKAINRIGDVDKVETSTIEQLVSELTPKLEYAYMVKQLARINNPKPPFNVELWVTDKERRDFMVGENIVFGFRSEKDCYVLLINLDSQGNFHVIFPNSFHRNNRVRANTTVLIPDEKMRTEEFKFTFGRPVGEETVKVIASVNPLNLKDLVDFEETFKSYYKDSRTIFVEEVRRQLSSDWSENKVVIRSHEQ